MTALVRYEGAQQRHIDEIVIGERIRKDMGDIVSLADSMKRHGLLHPVVIKPDGLLVAGLRRLEAAKLLAWKEITVTTIDVADLLGAERDENEVRKNFTPTEAVAIGRLIEAEHRKKIEAKAHLTAVMAGKRRQGDSHMWNPPPAAVGPTRETAARAVGMNVEKYTQAKAVVAAAETDPETFGDLPERMDETGNVAGTHREMERRKCTKAAAKRPRAERIVEMRALVQSGHNPEQIAEQQGIDVRTVRLMLNEAGIKVPGQKRGRLLDSNKIVRESVAALSGITQGLALVRHLDIDAEEAEALLSELRSAMKALRALDVTLKELVNGK